MGSVYARGRTLWIAFHEPSGKRVCRSSGYRVGQEALAAALLEEVERRANEQAAPAVRKGADMAPQAAGPLPSLVGLTVQEYGDRWIAGREHRVESVADEQGRLRNHVYPRIGHMLLRDVKPRHIRDMILDLTGAKVRRRGTGKGEGTSTIAPRTVRHVFATLHRMFKSAVIDEHIESNPVVVEKGVLPKNVDKDPAWRATAVFERGEVVSLIADARIPEVRRVLNALKALAALRHGEAAGLRWRDFHPRCEPLGKLVVSRSYEKARTKTQVTREVPVHAALAELLARWRGAGWGSAFGRAPSEDDLIVPGRDGQVWQAHDADDFFKDDLEALGMRHRRGHDLRRTFITLAQVDGARRDILKVMTHGPSADDIVSLYTSFPWPTLCGEVAKLAIELPSIVRAPIAIAEKFETKSAADVAATVATVPATVIPISSAISSRCPGMIRGPTVYETVALPLSYTGRSRGR
jgi:integrase